MNKARLEALGTIPKVVMLSYTMMSFSSCKAMMVPRFNLCKAMHIYFVCIDI
jgi:hypothetical protein